MPMKAITLHVTTLSHDRLLVRAYSDAGRLESVIQAGEIPDWQAAANWLLAQAGNLEPWGDDAARRKRVTLTWHLNEEGGRVLDTYLVEDLPESASLAALLASPLASVTVAQADAAVDAIANLADAKAYLKKANALTINMRDVLLKTLERLRDEGVI